MGGFKTQCIKEIDVCLFCVLLLGINIFHWVTEKTGRNNYELLCSY